MKPFWSFGSESYSWYKSSYVNRKAHEPRSGKEDEGKLYVPTYQEAEDVTIRAKAASMGWTIVREAPNRQVGVVRAETLFLSKEVLRRVVLAWNR